MMSLDTAYQYPLYVSLNLDGALYIARAHKFEKTGLHTNYNELWSWDWFIDGNYDSNVGGIHDQTCSEEAWRFFYRKADPGFLTDLLHETSRYDIKLTSVAYIGGALALLESRSFIYSDATKVFYLKNDGSWKTLTPTEFIYRWKKQYVKYTTNVPRLTQHERAMVQEDWRDCDTCTSHIYGYKA